MESHKPAQTAAELPGRSPLLLILAVLSVAAAVAGAFYLGLQKSAIVEEQKALDSDMVTLGAEISALEGQKIQAAQLAQLWMDEIREGEILWSRVITRIQSLLPVDPQTQESRIRILSYSGSQGGRLMLNAQTTEAQNEPYEYVSELLSVFNDSSYFADAIVPSITRGETDQGMKFLSFTLNFNYLPEESSIAGAETAAGDDDAAPAEDAAKPKVSRQ